MTAWLDPVRAALSAGDEPVDFFVRDDDAGWDDAGLFALLDVFERTGTPIDIAAIPAHISSSCAAELNRRRARQSSLRIHQHGFAHVNHEPDGRKCEFGPSRDVSRQQADIRQGRDRLTALLGETDLVFTPPWNRCTQATVKALEAEAFGVLSREHRASQLDIGGLASVPVTVDWRKKRADARDTPAQTAREIADQIRSGDGRLGLMLHHETLKTEDLEALTSLLTVMNDHARVRRRNIVELGKH